MIKSITVTNHLNESINIDLTNPEESGFIVKEITGLGPVKADVNLTELATNDGAIYNSARLEPRDINLSLGFFAHQHSSIEDVRLKTYKYFPIKRGVKFKIETDNRVAETEGIVEKNSPDIFSKEEGSQIVLRCADPYFYSTKSNYLTFYAVDPLFEFEFGNEDVSKNLLEMGEIVNIRQGVITYTGDAEVGIVMTIHAIGEVKGVIIYNDAKKEVLRINDEKLKKLTGSGIIAGDDITITTIRGKKSAILLRGGTRTNVLNALEKPLQWFQLSKGDNVFSYSAEKGFYNLIFTIENKVIYEGV